MSTIPTLVRDTPSEAPLEVRRIRADFPALLQEVNGHPLVYLDNAATTQKPQVVIECIRDYYERDNANVHRGLHALSMRATEAYEAARHKVQRFINAGQAEEIVFVRGATEAINLVAQTFGRAQVRAGDEILISEMEHHSNIVPWQMLCEQTGAVLRVVPMDDRGELRMEEYEHMLGPRTRLVAVTHVSNALGTVNPVEHVIARAHSAGAVVLVDGAQAVPHMPVDVRALDCDFYVFSSHKTFGPTGVGVLYGRYELLESMAPYQGGGEMITSVTFEKTTFREPPARFEAGTPNIAGAIGLGAAVEYLERLGRDAIMAYERDLLAYGAAALGEIPQVRLIGTASEKAGILSFVLKDIHPHDVGTVLDTLGIAIRSGHHCAQSVMQHFGVPATCRAALAFYNTHEEIDALAAGIRQVVKVFS